MSCGRCCRHETSWSAFAAGSRRLSAGYFKTFSVMFGKNVGGFARRAEEIFSGELPAAPKIKAIVEAALNRRCSGISSACCLS